MAFLNKADSLKLAKQLGIPDAEHLGWQELQRAIGEAQKQGTPAPKEQRPKAAQKAKNPYADYYGRQVFISPELPPERYRLIKYDEDLGEDINLVERQFEMNPETDQVYDISGADVNYNGHVAAHDYTTGTYRIIGRNGKRVTAMSSVPKENYGSGMTIGKDYVPVVSWNGRNGYLWTHHAYPNVKALLIESGYYHEYKHLFTREPNIWYVAGKTLACDIGLVHSIFAEIEEKEKRKRQENDAYRKSLGL